MEKIRLLRITTVPVSLTTLLKGQLHFFSKKGFDVLTVSSSGSEVNQLLDEGIKHVSINMTRRISPIRDFISLIKLILLIRKFRPQIVHTHTPKAGLLGMLASYLCRVPMRMHTIAGLVWMESSGIKKQLLMLTEKITYLCSTKVYPNSLELRKYLIDRLNFHPDKAVVIANGSSNGIDASYFNATLVPDDQRQELKSKYKIDDDDFVFCFVGRVVKDKGIVELVEAVEKLKSKKVKLLLVGNREQDLDPIPEDTLLKIRNNSSIIETGYQKDVRLWLSICNVFVFPSYREGFPNVVMQAGCMALPCIVTDINGCNEIIQHKQSGLIIPVKDVHALKDAMEFCMEQPDLIKAMGIKAREFVAGNFSQELVWNELLKEYNTSLLST